jgi:hypothetical protein
MPSCLRMALSVPVLISAEERRGICETRPWKKALVCRVPCSKVHPSFASLRFSSLAVVP